MAVTAMALLSNSYRAIQKDMEFHRVFQLLSILSYNQRSFLVLLNSVGISGSCYFDCNQFAEGNFIKPKHRSITCTTDETIR